MERRDLLKGGVLLGTALAAEGADAAWNTPPPSLSFYEGRLSGEDFEGWVFAFSILGSRAQGFAYDPETVDGDLQALRFEGRVRSGRRLSMEAFALEDVNHLHALGELSGKGSAGAVRGTFGLSRPAARGGGFHARLVPISERLTRRLAGVYRSAAGSHGGPALYEATLTAHPNLEWELRDIEAAPGVPALAGAAARRLKGHYAVATDGRLLLRLTRVPLRFRRGSGGTSGTQPADAQHAASVPPVPLHASKKVRRPRSGRVHAASTFSDGTLADADWEAVKVFDQTPGQAAFFETFQSGSAGNPGSFRETIQGFNTGEVFGFFDVANVQRHFVYEPAVDGPLGSVSYAWDLIDLSGADEQGTGRYFPLVRQGGQYFFGQGQFNNATENRWRSFSHPGLTASGFVRTAGLTSEHPDFETGGPLEFGYLVRGTALPNRQVSLTTGLDNFSVVATPAEVQRGLTLAGSEDPVARIEAAYVATVRDAGGQPVPGQPVLFVLETEGSTPISSTVQTDSNGQARFRHTFPPGMANSNFTLTACIDADGSGTCDPLEPADTIDGSVGSLGLSLGEGPSDGTAAPSTQVCYTGRVSGGGLPLPGQPLLLMQAGGEEPLARGTTDSNGSVQLCFTTPGSDATLSLFACLDLDGNDRFNEGEPRSNTVALAVQRSAPPADTSCAECCLGVLIILLQGGSGAVGEAGAEIALEHPLTHVVGSAKRIA